MGRDKSSASFFPRKCCAAYRRIRSDRFGLTTESRLMTETQGLSCSRRLVLSAVWVPSEITTNRFGRPTKRRKERMLAACSGQSLTPEREYTVTGTAPGELTGGRVARRF